jgi:hypothetical protein
MDQLSILNEDHRRCVLCKPATWHGDARGKKNYIAEGSIIIRRWSVRNVSLDLVSNVSEKTMYGSQERFGWTFTDGEFEWPNTGV